MGEFLFWNEFGTRYNFIAVDSLIYTDGIKGNGLDSYPIVPMVSILTLISLVITIFFVKKDKNKFEEFPNFKIKLANAFIYIGMIVGAFFLLKFTQEQETSDNDFVNELQANGLYRFYNAYNQGSLSYDKLYAKLPEEKAFSIVNKQYGNPEQKENNVKIIKDSIPEIRKNVVVITMEGMNSNFMKYFGNASNLTPNLNKLAEEGMFFTNFYSVGDQTVKGLEALTLCIPPSPGRSLIRRENNTNLFSTGYLFKKRGYTVQFLYGGYGSFNNMETFFEGNGYQVIDRGSFSQEEITFTNTSGVCDEDLFNKAIKNFDADYKKGNPFFGHIMTVSNHRPFTFPKRKIALSSGKNSHAGSIKYTDYAIGKFIKEAQKHSWFSNTVFVFVAGCRTSTSETTEIHPNEYHIPAIIYAPGFIQPEKVTVLTSQIDLMPTLLGKLHFSYTSHFYGQDVFNSNYQPRVFMSTYQKLGYLKDNTLTVLSPNQKTDQFTVGVKGQMNKNDKKNKTLSEEAIANYQTASYLIKNNLLKIK